jgi:hypothetical protein
VEIRRDRETAIKTRPKATSEIQRLLGLRAVCCAARVGVVGPTRNRYDLDASNSIGDGTVVSAKLADAGLNLEALYVVRLAGDMVELALARQNSTVERL